MPATPARTMDGDAPVSSTYVATTGSSSAVRTQAVDAEQREGERPHGAQQHHVLAGHGHDVQQPAAPEVLDQRLVDALVVAEDHALQHLGDRRVDAGEQVGARREAEPVHEALQAAAAADDGQVGEVGLEQHVLAAPSQVAAVVERARAWLRERLDAHRRQAQQRALGEGAGRVVADSVCPSSSRRRRCAGSRIARPSTAVTRTASVTWSSLTAGRSMRTAVSATCWPVYAGERRPLDGIEPGAADERARADEQRRRGLRRSAPSRAASASAGARAGRHEERRRRERRPLPAARAAAATPAPGTGPRSSRRAGGEEARAVASTPPQTVMESFMAANLASPMPGTSLISSTVLKPPFSVR